MGGAHVGHEQMALSLKENILAALERMDEFSMDELLERRYERLMSYGL